jgi:pimeloyl-ACP methyl ester carboxylesterase
MAEHRTTTADGRTIALAEYGAPEGRPVVLLPAAPGSRALDPDPEATRAAAIRLLVIDRPGYGESTAYPGGTVPTWAGVADDVESALAALDVGAVTVAGWSNGGVGALALAARHPERVSSVIVIATPAPHEEVPWVADAFWPMLLMLRQRPEAATATLGMALQPVVQDMDAAVAGLGSGDADERLLAGPVRERLEAMLVEAFRQGTAGLAADIAATNVVPWGFDLGDVRAPVQLYYGDDDGLVTPAHGRHFEERLPQTSLRTVPDAGHLLLIEHWGEILAAIPSRR